MEATWRREDRKLQELLVSASDTCSLGVGEASCQVLLGCPHSHPCLSVRAFGVQAVGSQNFTVGDGSETWPRTHLLSRFTERTGLRVGRPAGQSPWSR